MGRRDHTKLYHLHGRAQVTITSQRPIASDPTRVGHGVCEVQGEQGLGREEQDGWLVRSETS